MKMRESSFIVCGLVFLCSKICAMQLSISEISRPSCLALEHIGKFLYAARHKKIFSNNCELRRYMDLASEREDWAEVFGNKDAMGVLIESAYQLKVPVRFGSGKMEMAVSLGTPGALEWCKQYVANNEDERQLLNNKFLVAAAFEKNIANVVVWLQAGADIDTVGYCEHSSSLYYTYKPAFISAVHTMNYELLNSLILRNANPNVVTPKKGRTPLMICIRELGLMKVGRRFQYTESRVMMVLRTLVHLPTINKDQVDRDGKSALHYAQQYKLTEVVEMLQR